MADIHVLSIRPCNTDLDRVTSLLAVAFAEGIDLGPREHHIQALVSTLKQNLEVLQKLVADLDNDPIRALIELSHLQSSIARLTVTAERLVESAKSTKE